jgi:hypothetical protein
LSKLLKEAIADAKAVRETALANARLALEEAFAPKLQSMLTKKLREDESLEDDEVENTDSDVEEGSYHEDDESVFSTSSSSSDSSSLSFFVSILCKRGANASSRASLAFARAVSRTAFASAIASLSNLLMVNYPYYV